MSTGTAADWREYDLVEAIKQQSWLKLPLAVMKDVGPAVQTLGCILAITNKETFSEAASIASKASLPLWTCRKHLVTLHEHAWLINAGRQHTRTGRPRRTCTLRLPPQTRGVLEPYGMLPWWATCKPYGRESLTWASKAVLSIVMSRLAGLIKKVIELDGKADTYADEVWGSIANLNGDDRHFLFSRKSLADQTGLDPKSITNAKRDLASRGIVRWTAFRRPDGGDDKHALEPQETFKIRIQPTGDDRCFVHWVGGKNGK